MDPDAAPWFGTRTPSLFLIAGPCVLEGPDVNLAVGKCIAEVGREFDIHTVFKASFDKANRTSLSSPRGPGLSRGLEALAEIRDRVGLPVLTDIHLPDQAAEAAKVVDVLQIPAFLSRQTDLLLAAAATGRPVNVKKGQWMAPEDMRAAVVKLRERGAKRITLTERGTAFGYGRWVVDMRSFKVMADTTACPTVFDASHSVQLPGGRGHASGGEPEFIETLAGAAVAAGADGIFVEVHPDPSVAPSDGANMLPLERLRGLVERCVRVRASLRS